MKKATFVALLFLANTISVKAQSAQTFADSGGSCSIFTVSHNGTAALNWVCQAAIQSGSLEANSISFSVVLNPDGSFNNGYISFYDQAGQREFMSTNFTGNYDSGKFSGVFSGTKPNGAFFSGQTNQLIASRVAIVRGARHTYYSIADGSGGDVTFANND